jgi:hypothetical protein
MRKILFASLFLTVLLTPGARVFVEDRMSDRAVVRISNDADTKQHFLLMAVPSTELSAQALSNWSIRN